ncbi:MAG: hypothetical protein WD826_10015, partial [Actinomycetota bacterium]
MLTGAGISIGVALFFGSLIANTSSSGQIDEAAAEAAGNIDVVITPIGDLRQAVLSGRVDEEASKLPGVRSAVGVAAFPTTMSTADGRALSYEVNSGAPPMLLRAAVDD